MSDRDEWLDNEGILEGGYVLPHAEMLLYRLALETWVLVMDGVSVGRDSSHVPRR